MSAHIIFVIISAVCFGLAALRVQAPVDFTPLGFLFAVLALAL